MIILYIVFIRRRMRGDSMWALIHLSLFNPNRPADRRPCALFSFSRLPRRFCPVAGILPSALPRRSPLRLRQMRQPIFRQQNKISLASAGRLGLTHNRPADRRPCALFSFSRLPRRFCPVAGILPSALPRRSPLRLRQMRQPIFRQQNKISLASAGRLGLTRNRPADRRACALFSFSRLPRRLLVRLFCMPFFRRLAQACARCMAATVGSCGLSEGVSKLPDS